MRGADDHVLPAWWWALVTAWTAVTIAVVAHAFKEIG